MQGHVDSGHWSVVWVVPPHRMANLGHQGGEVLRQTGLRLRGRSGCLSPPGRQATIPPRHERGGRPDAAALLDDGEPAWRDQGPLHASRGASGHALGARGCARSDAAPARCRSRGDAGVAQDDGASFGTLKARPGAAHFLMKTLPRVSGDEAVHHLAPT